MATEASEITHATPGDRIVCELGGVKVVAELAEGSVKSVYRWLQPADKGGGGGLVPLPAQRRMVANARERGLPLDFADFAPKAGEVVL